MVRSRGAPTGSRDAYGSANPLQETRGHDRTPLAPEARAAIRARDRHLVYPGAGRPDRERVAPVRGVHRSHRLRARQRVSAADGLDDRRSDRRPHRDDHARTGILGFRQCERPARGRRVHRRAGRGEVGARPADQPLVGEPVRWLTPWPRLQHRDHRRGHRTGISQQHGARRRAVPDRAVRGHGSRLRRPTTPRDGGSAAT